MDSLDESVLRNALRHAQAVIMSMAVVSLDAFQVGGDIIVMKVTTHQVMICFCIIFINYFWLLFWLHINVLCTCLYIQIDIYMNGNQLYFIKCIIFWNICEYIWCVSRTNE